MTFVIIAGGIDLSVGSVMGLASVVAPLAAVQDARRPDALAPRWSSSRSRSASSSGFINGFVIAYGKVVAFMATLAMLVAARGLAEILSERARRRSSNSAGFLDFFRSDFLGIAVLIWIFVIVAVSRLGPAQPHDLRPPHRRDRRQPRGRSSRRHQGQAPHGVRSTRSPDCAAGIAGVMMLGRTTAGTSTHGQLYELDAIAAVVVGGTLLIGGRGTITGTVLGVLIFATLTNVFTQNNLSTSVQAVAKGIIIVVAVLLQQRFAARGPSR